MGRSRGSRLSIKSKDELVEESKDFLAIAEEIQDETLPDVEREALREKLSDRVIFGIVKPYLYFAPMTSRESAKSLNRNMKVPSFLRKLSSS